MGTRTRLLRRRAFALAVAFAGSFGLSASTLRLPAEAPVADAVMRGDIAAAKALLKQGADVNAAQADGMTALHWAASRGDAELARTLAFAGARVDAITRNGNYTPLHLAARGGRADAVKALLESGANVNAATSSGGATALHFASSFGDSATVGLLLDKGAPVDTREKAYQQTPLMWASAANRTAAMRVLLKRGADIEATSKVEDIPAQERALRAELTARSRRVAALKAAEQGPAAGGATAGAGPQGARPAAPAVPATGAPATASSAASPAAPAARRDSSARPARAAGAAATASAAAPAAATAAAAPGDTTRRAATGFNNRGPSYGELIGNKGGLTPLLFAVREGHADATRVLLDAGAKINHVSAGDKSSPLLMASMNGHFDLAKSLLEKGADVKLASDAGATPLYVTINVQWAAKSLYPQPTAQLNQRTTYLELMEAYLKAGADVNARLKKHLWYMSYNFDLLGVNTTGATPFWRAAYGTDVEAMRLLKKHGADHTVATTKPTGRLPGDDAPPEDDAAGGKDPSGLPPVPDGGPGVHPIHAASGVGYGEGYAANSHRHAPDGWIPSMKYLIEELGADVNARDFNGYTPLHHAAARGDNDAIKYLMSKGADINAVSRRGQTVADMANGPVQRIPPFLETVELLVKLGSKNSNKCRSC